MFTLWELNGSYNIAFGSRHRIDVHYFRYVIITTWSTDINLLLFYFVILFVMVCATIFTSPTNNMKTINFQPSTIKTMRNGHGCTVYSGDLNWTSEQQQTATIQLQYATAFTWVFFFLLQLNYGLRINVVSKYSQWTRQLFQFFYF